MVSEIAQEEANSLVSERQAAWSGEFRRRFEDEAFSEECRIPGQFSALPPERRSYYTVDHRGRREVLVGIRFLVGSDPLTANISSIARILEKDEDAAQGWWYLKEIVETILIPKGAKRIYAKLNKGSRHAFEELQRRLPKGYTVHVDQGLARIEVYS